MEHCDALTSAKIDTRQIRRPHAKIDITTYAHNACQSPCDYR
jgi:hypothetical protein